MTGSSSVLEDHAGEKVLTLSNQTMDALEGNDAHTGDDMHGILRKQVMQTGGTSKNLVYTVDRLVPRHCASRMGDPVWNRLPSLVLLQGFGWSRAR